MKERRKKIKREIKKQKEKYAKKQKLHFGPLNYVLLILGVISIGAGFYFLNEGSITLAPILMVLGYLVFIPVGLLWRGKEK